MKKGISIIFFFLFSFSFAQLSEIPKIDKEVDKKFKAIWKKYKKTQSEERNAEIEEVYRYRREGYQKAIEVIQSGDEKIDFENLKFSESSTYSDFESGISGFRKLISKFFDSSGVEHKKGTLQTEIRFVIDENGKATNVKAFGDDEDFNLASLIAFYKACEEGKWKPSMDGQKPVKSLYRIPLTLKFE